MLLVAGLAVVAAGCRGDDGASAAGGGAPGSLPREEGRLDLVAWPGLVEDGTDDPKLY